MTNMTNAAPLAPLSLDFSVDESQALEHDAVLFGRQEIERGQFLAMGPSSSLALAWPTRVTWHDLGQPAALAAGAGSGWASVKGVTFDRTSEADRRNRARVAAVLVAALADFERPSVYHALDFTGMPLTEAVLEAIKALAKRSEPAGILVIAEHMDAFYLAREWS